jgi:hypothetical protein
MSAMGADVQSNCLAEWLLTGLGKPEVSLEKIQKIRFIEERSQTLSR